MDSAAAVLMYGSSLPADVRRAAACSELVEEDFFGLLSRVKSF